MEIPILSASRHREIDVDFPEPYAPGNGARSGRVSTPKPRTIEIKLPPLHAGQKAIAKSSHPKSAVTIAENPCQKLLRKRHRI